MDILATVTNWRGIAETNTTSFSAKLLYFLNKLVVDMVDTHFKFEYSAIKVKHNV